MRNKNKIKIQGTEPKKTSNLTKNEAKKYLDEYHANIAMDQYVTFVTLEKKETQAKNIAKGLENEINVIAEQKEIDFNTGKSGDKFLQFFFSNIQALETSNNEIETCAKEIKKRDGRAIFTTRSFTISQTNENVETIIKIANQLLENKDQKTASFLLEKYVNNGSFTDITMDIQLHLFFLKIVHPDQFDDNSQSFLKNTVFNYKIEYQEDLQNVYEAIHDLLILSKEKSRITTQLQNRVLNGIICLLTEHDFDWNENFLKALQIVANENKSFATLITMTLHHLVPYLGQELGPEEDSEEAEDDFVYYDFFPGNFSEFVDQYGKEKLLTFLSRLLDRLTNKTPTLISLFRNFNLQNDHNDTKFQMQNST